NDRLDLWIAFDYGGRAELADAAKRLVQAGIRPEEIDEDTFARALYEPELPDPDLLIRTAGDQRISNFLLWQLAYAELVFVETPWPDFGEAELRAALSEYASRERRFGGIPWMRAGFLSTIALAFALKGISDTRQSLAVAIATTVFGVAWIGLGLGHALLLRSIPEHGRLAVFTVLLTVFAADAFAYFV